MNECLRYWLAGLLEGEGTFMCGPPSAPNRPSLRLAMTDRDVVDRAGELLEARGVSLKQPERHAQNGWKPVFVVYIRGAKAVAMMKDLYPLMGERRRKQIDRVLSSYIPRSAQVSESEARELARRYHAGDRHPTALGREYGIGKNAAIYWINKYKPG